VFNHPIYRMALDETKICSTPKGLNVHNIMGSYRQIYYHIVFGTKYRQPTITEAHCEELYKYISGVIENKKSKLYRINGVEDHIHWLIL
jgi:REP element-mobilizing transposase RayT